MSPVLNVYFAWSWILTGMIVGAILGLFFYRSDFLGGFDAWPRRMVRLGHIAFLGTALLNLAFAFSLPVIHPASSPAPLLIASSYLFILGAVTMPSVCLLSAFRPAFRHLFFIPAGSLIAAVVLTLLHGVLQ